MENLKLKRDKFAIGIANLRGIGKNYLSEINGIILTHSDKELLVDGKEYIFVRAERPNEDGFDFAEFILPEIAVYLSFGFKDNELLYLRNYLEKSLGNIISK